MKIDVKDFKKIVDEWNCDLVVNRNNTRSHKYFVIDRKTTEILASTSTLEDAEKTFTTVCDRWKKTFIDSGCLSRIVNGDQYYSSYVLIAGKKIKIYYDIFSNEWYCTEIPRHFTSFISAYKYALDMFNDSSSEENMNSVQKALV
ncbi:hypothetical protein [Nostoc phage A1]|nr:hypothetical protein [Nostoc phage A1]